jgi:maltooligosyltrehalose trehalohydrolase
VLLSPFLPLLFMGEEYGENAPFSYFVSHSDSELIEAVRRGRGNEFKQFKWDGSLPDPESEATFASSKLNWELQKEDWHPLLREFYRELLRMRREIPTLASLDLESTDAVALPGEKTVVLRRGERGARVVSVFHFGERGEKVPVEIPAARWQKILDSKTERWGSGGSEIPDWVESTGKIELQLGASSVFVLREMEEKNQR